jgi:hypothetical protein
MLRGDLLSFAPGRGRDRRALPAPGSNRAGHLPYQTTGESAKNRKCAAISILCGKILPSFELSKLP